MNMQDEKLMGNVRKLAQMEMLTRIIDNSGLDHHDIEKLIDHLQRKETFIVRVSRLFEQHREKDPRSPILRLPRPSLRRHEEGGLRCLSPIRELMK